MTLFEIVGLYTALNLILMIILSMRVSKVRMREKVSLGDGENSALMLRIRAHANYTENAPLVLIGLFVLAGLQAAPLALHIFGAVFTLGRVAHAHGMDSKNGNGGGRMVGSLSALLVTLGMAVYMLYLIFVR